MSNIKDNEILTYEEARDTLVVLELRIGQEVESWSAWSKENIEVPAGQVAITNGANEIMQSDAGLQWIRKSLARHIYGDFGDLKDYEDWQENILSVWTNEGRILSRYRASEDIEGAKDIYIITEGRGVKDYRYTTIMLVNEY